jgi:transcriptional regulator with XRE-family HTH domain
MKKQRPRKLNNCLRKYRKARGLKQKEVALILGLQSTSIISRWEKGVCLPDTLNALKLSVLYRTFVNGLFIDHFHELQEQLKSREQLVLANTDNNFIEQ